MNKILSNKKTQIIFLLLIWLAIVFGGYFKSKYGEPEANQPSYGVATRLSSSTRPIPIGADDPGSKTIYKLKTDSAFTGTYSLGSKMPKNTQYLMLTFIDYKQVPFYLNGKKGLSHLIPMSASSTRYFSFKTERLKEGVHDFANILILHPHGHSLDAEKRLDTDNNYFFDLRANLIVGKGGQYKLSKKVSGKQRVNKEQFDGIIINKRNAGKLAYWLKERVKSAKLVKYFVHLGNKDLKPKNFAVIALLDYKQIPLNPDGLFTGRLGAKRTITIPATLKAPNQKGIHELLIFLITEPFVKLPSEKSKQSIPPIYSSARIPIVVE